MRFVRKIIADRMSGGVLALLLSFMMMLDGAIGAHAVGAMAAAERLAASQIICSTDTGDQGAHAGHDGHGTNSAKPLHHKHGGKAEHPECCSAACQFAAQVAAADLPTVLAPQWPLLQNDEAAAWHAVPVASRPDGLFKDARGPPSISI